MSEPIKLIVGLGNPGQQYQGTRHNAGADFVAELARQAGATLKAESKFLGLAGRWQAAGLDCRLLVPTTYMNRSGQSVSLAAQFYKIDAGNILVVHDELDFAAGTARFKQGGGHGGHNGLRDICKAIGPDFMRLRIGIGHPGSAAEVTNYVLKAPSLADRELLEHSMQDAIAALPRLVHGNWVEATHQLHNS